MSRTNKKLSNIELDSSKVLSHITTDDKLLCFMYLLLRDHVKAGDLERIISKVEDKTDLLSMFSSWDLTLYARKLTESLR